MLYNLLANIETAKALKANIINITKDGTIIGCDEKFTFVKVMQSKDKDATEHTEAEYLINAMNDFIKIMNPIGATLTNGIIESVCDTFNTRNPIFKNGVTNTYLTFTSICDTSHSIFSYENLRGDEVFESSLQKKADEGITLFKINPTYILTLFKGLLPVNKGDKVSLDIYDVNPNVFIAKFVISKPKNVKISVYIAYNKLG